MPRRLVALGLAIAAALVVAAPASASLSDEVRAGQALVRQLQAGKASCGQLATRDFEHLGEYVMGRMAGSVRLHEAMNQRMRSVMGTRSEERMHVLMGQRYGGCAATGDAGPMMGTGMMRSRGWSSDSTWGPMMDSRGWDWMRDGNWQHMSRADWQRVSDRWMGSGMMRPVGGVWQARDYVLAGVAVLLVAGLLTALLAWRPWRMRSHAP